MIRGKTALFMLVALVVFCGGIAALGFAFRRGFSSPVAVIQNLEGSESTHEAVKDDPAGNVTAALEKGLLALAAQKSTERRALWVES